MLQYLRQQVEQRVQLAVRELLQALYMLVQILNRFLA